MSDKSILDQAKDAASTAGVLSTHIACLVNVLLHCASYDPDSPVPPGEKLKQGTKSMTGATAGKVWTRDLTLTRGCLTPV